jgi:hypothetical protein
MEQALHGPVIADAGQNIPLESVFGVQTRRLEPLDIRGIVEHVLDDGVALVNFHGESSQDNALENQAISVCGQDGTHGNYPIIHKHDHWRGGVGDRTKNAGSPKHRQEALERVFVTVQIQLREDGSALPRAPPTAKGHNVFRLYESAVTVVAVIVVTTHGHV